MFGFGNLVKLKSHAVLLKFPGHELGLFERHIRVRRAVDQHRRWIGGGDILDRHERTKLFRFAARIPSGDRFWPLTGLAAEIVEDTAVTLALTGVGDRRTAHLLPRFFGGDLSL